MTEALVRGVVAFLMLLLAALPSAAAHLALGMAAFERGDYAMALREFRPLAEQGHAQAQLHMGLMYHAGDGVPKDGQIAAFWYRQAAEQGYALAQLGLGLVLDEGEGVPEDDREAAFWYRKAAEQGNATAQFSLGVMFDKGEGVPEDDREAALWYREAAEQGHADAQNSLGVMYATGEGVPKDGLEAVLWILKAAEQGHAEAQKNLGVMYAEGKGVPKDGQIAAFWYRQAAEQGYALAQLGLGLVLDEGEGVPEDDREAAFWYRKAAERGHALAQFRLGQLFDKGEGVPEDDREAAFWYREAAEQGNATAQFSLGVMFDKGEGVPRNDREAAFWYREAAEQGYVRAQHNLGVLYATGAGIPKDDVQAYVWFNLAAAQGDEHAQKYRIRVRNRLTPVQIGEAQSLSRQIAARSAESRPEPTGFASEPRSPGKRVEPSNLLGSGTGFLVALDGSILTSHHVVDDCARVTVKHAGNGHDAETLAVEAVDDLALLKLKAAVEPGTAATFSQSSRANLGQAATVAGYPLHGLLSKEFNVTSGNVSALAGPGDDAKRLQISAPVQQGNSGGPLLDAAGNVIGVVVSKLNAVRTAELTGDLPQNVNFAIKAAVVRGFLDIHGVAYRRRPSTPKLASEQLAELAQTFTVSVHCWD